MYNKNGVMGPGHWFVIFALSRQVNVYEYI